jgi:hypothetical protein
MKRIRDVYLGSEFFPSRVPDPGSKRFPDPVSGSASKNLSILTQKIVSKLSIIWSKMFIADTDPGSWFFYPSRTPDPGVKRHRIPVPGSGSATLIEASIY